MNQMSGKINTVVEYFEKSLKYDDYTISPMFFYDFCIINAYLIHCFIAVEYSFSGLHNELLCYDKLLY